MPLIHGQAQGSITKIAWCVLFVAGAIVAPEDAGADDRPDVAQLEQAFQQADEAIRLNPASAQAYIARAAVWATKGAFDSALTDLNEAIRLDSKSVVAYVGRGSVLTKQGETERAIKDLTQALDLDPLNAIAHLYRGKAWEAIRDLDQALADLDEAIRLNPKIRGGHSARAAVRVARSEFNEAVDDFNEALRVDPKNVETLCARASCFDAKRDYDRATADFDEAVRLRPTDARIVMNRARVWVERRDFDKALADAEEAVRLAPNYPRAYSIRAGIWALRRDFDKAIGDYTTAIQIDSKLQEGYRGRAAAWATKGNFESAMEDLGVALQINPRDSAALVQRAKIHLEQFDVDAAEADFNEAIRVSPNDAFAWRSRGRFRLQWGETHEALEDYNTAIHIQPHSSEMLRERAEIWKTFGDQDRAAEDFAKAIMLNPNDSRAIVSLAIIQANKGNLEDALAGLDRAVERSPENAHCLSWRGHLRLLKGNPDEALVDFAGVLKREPNNIWVRSRRGGIWLKRGELDKALEDFGVVLVRQSNSDIYTQRAMVHKAKGDLGRAIDDLSSAIQLETNAIASAKPTIPHLRLNSGQPEKPNAGYLKGLNFDDSLANPLKTSETSGVLENMKLSEILTDSPKATETIDKKLASAVETPAAKNNAVRVALYLQRGELRESTGDIEAALSDYNEAIALDLTCKSACLGRAWILATAADPALRDGARAVVTVALIDKITVSNHADAMMALAAAHAEAGNFSQAVNWQQQVLDAVIDAEIGGQMLENLQTQLRMYESGRPFRESNPPKNTSDKRRALAAALAEHDRQRAKNLADNLNQQELTTKTYDVGDMLSAKSVHWRVVVAEDGSSTISKAAPESGDASSAAAPERPTLSELEKLVSLIERTAAPDSWGGLGGSGSISADQNREILVVRQTPDVHSEVCDLVAKLRRDAAREMAVRIDVLTLREVDLQTSLDLDDEPRNAYQQAAFLSENQVQALNGLIDKSDRAATMKPVQLTLGNGNSAALKLRYRSLMERNRPLPEIQMEAALKEDFAAISIIAMGTDRAGSPRGRRRFNIPRGESLLTDITDFVEVPADAADRTNADGPGERVLLLITPNGRESP